MVEKLASIGIFIDLHAVVFVAFDISSESKQVEKIAGEAAIGRPHIAQVQTHSVALEMMIFPFYFRLC